MDDLLPFRGILCPGVYFSSRKCISLLSWAQAPIGPPSFSQVWITDADGSTVCYIDAPSAGEVFRFYHNFPCVIGSRLNLTWSAPEDLHVELAAESISLDLHLRTAAPLVVRGTNALLRTPAARLLRTRGMTDAGKRFVHEPHRLAAIESAEATLNGISLGTVLPAPPSLSVAGNAVPRRPILSFCTHYLERRPDLGRSTAV